MVPIENPRGFWVESETAVAKGDFEVASATLRRQGKENEDVMLVCDDGSGVFVADGMGGYPGGALFASAAAHAGVSALSRGMSAREAVKEAARAAASVEEHVLREHGGAAGLGLRFLEDGKVECSARGDVVAWVVSENGVEEVFEPQCEGFRLIDYLGKSKRGPDESCSGVLQLDEGSVLVVMTDGAWRFISPPELSAVALRDCPLEDSALEIMGQAVVRMTPDDASILACRFAHSADTLKTDGI